MADWTIIEAMLILAAIFALGFVSAIITWVLLFPEREKRYEKPVQRVAPRDWNFPKDDWDERITKG